MDLPEPLAETLKAIADGVGEARDRWWVVGSAAAGLLGADVGEVRDVDLLMSRRDARRLLLAHGVTPAPGRDDGLFRSVIFGRIAGYPIDIEVMAGLHLRGRELALRTRLAVPVQGRTLFVPTKAEFLRLLARFGREKDLARASALRALG